MYLAMQQEHQVVFRPKKNQTSGRINQTNAALMADFGKWNTRVTRVMWVTSHSINGLGPIRPVVVVGVPFELPAKMCLELKI